MLRSRRESHHNDGITERDCLQQTSTTKSARNRHQPIARPPSIREEIHDPGCQIVHCTLDLDSATQLHCGQHRTVLANVAERDGPAVLKTAFGTDILFDARLTTRQGSPLVPPV